MIDDLPTGVRELVARHLASMDHVTVLLLLRQAAPGDRSASAIATELQIEPKLVTQVLRDLSASKLIRNLGGTSAGPFVFAPGSDALRETVAALEDAYNRRPVTLIRALYARPPRPVQSFADAFRLHDDPENDG